MHHAPSEAHTLADLEVRRGVASPRRDEIRVPRGPPHVDQVRCARRARRGLMHGALARIDSGAAVPTSVLKMASKDFTSLSFYGKGMNGGLCQDLRPIVHRYGST